MNKLNLKEEIKCDFLVTEERKNVWKIELDILEKIIAICKKHNIKYLADGGTALGIVRHKGFIPWDDDIDIIMKRNDYEKFMEVAEKELKEPYFLQCYKTEKGFHKGFIKIRNSNTTAFTWEDDKNNFNKGIWVDIFPIDNVPDDENERDVFLKKIRKKKLFILTHQNTDSKKIIKKIVKLFLKNVYWKIFNVDKQIKKLEEYVKKYNNIETKEGRILIMSDGFVYKNSWFNEVIQMDFEYLKLSIFKEYDKFLKINYGDDYIKNLKREQPSLHGKTFFNAEKSYKTYSIDEIKKITSKLKNK